jgi:hypothetical protein
MVRGRAGFGTRLRLCALGLLVAIANIREPRVVGLGFDKLTELRVAPTHIIHFGHLMQLEKLRIRDRRMGECPAVFTTAPLVLGSVVGSHAKERHEGR